MTMLVRWGEVRGYYRHSYREISVLMEYDGPNRIYAKFVGGALWCIWEYRKGLGWVIADTDNNRDIGMKAKPRHQNILDETYQRLLMEEVS